MVLVWEIFLKFLEWTLILGAIIKIKFYTQTHVSLGLLGRLVFIFRGFVLVVIVKDHHRFAFIFGLSQRQD